MHRAAIAAAATAILAGCYAKTPPRRPEIDLPELTEGGRLTLEPRSTWERDRDGVPRRVRFVELDYEGKSLTYSQVARAVTPDWEEKGAQYDKKRARCKRYQFPRTVATTMMLGSIIFFYYGSSVIEDQRTRLLASAGGWLGGLGVYTAGYFVGGSICNDAAEMYDTYYRLHRTSRFYGGSDLDDVKKLVRTFNERFASASAR